MKLTVLISICLTLMSISCKKEIDEAKSQDFWKNRSLSGFMDMKWGIPKDSVKTKMLKKAKYVEYLDFSDYMVFNEGDFAGRKVKNWNFNFTENKLSSVRLEFEIKDYNVKNGVINNPIGELLVKDLIVKYGKPTSNDSTTIRGACSTMWLFNNGEINLLFNYPYKETTTENNVRNFSITYRHIPETDSTVNETKYVKKNLNEL